MILFTKEVPRVPLCGIDFATSHCRDMYLKAEVLMKYVLIAMVLAAGVAQAKPESCNNKTNEGFCCVGAGLSFAGRKAE